MKHSRLFVILSILAVLFAVRYHTFNAFHGDLSLKKYVGEKITLEGIIVDEPVRKEKYTQLIINVAQNTHVIARADLYGVYQYGDKVTVTGKLEQPENFATDNGRTFNYVKYLAKDRIFYIVSFPTVRVLEHGHGNTIVAVLFTIKHAFTQALDTSLPFIEAKLAAGLVVAGKQALPKSVQDAFQITGTIQIVVLSGYNVTIIIEMLLALLSVLPRMISISVGAMGIVLFAIMTGANAAIVRAVVMALIGLLGKILRRPYNVGRALVVSAVIMVFHNPMLLLYDPSFQLSFVATLGLIYATPIAEKRMQWIPEKFKLREVIASTVATQIFLTPLLLYMIGDLSIVALPANFLLSFIIPITMLAGFLTGIMSMVSLVLAWPIKIAAYLLLATILMIVRLFASLPFASISLPAFPLWVVGICYIVFGIILMRNQKTSQSLPS
jgi:competence protein ComEC